MIRFVATPSTWYGIVFRKNRIDVYLGSKTFHIIATKDKEYTERKHFVLRRPWCWEIKVGSFYWIRRT